MTGKRLYLVSPYFLSKLPLKTFNLRTVQFVVLFYTLPIHCELSEVSTKFLHWDFPYSISPKGVVRPSCLLVDHLRILRFDLRNF